MGKGDGSNISVVWAHVKIYLAVALLAVLHFFTKIFEFRTELSNASPWDEVVLQILLLFETIEFYWSVILVLTILVGFNIARTTERKKSLVNSFSAGFIGALSYQIIMGIFVIIMILSLTDTEVTEDAATSESEEADFSIIEYLSTPIFHGILAVTIAITFQGMGPISRDRLRRSEEFIQGLSRQSHSHSGVIMGHTKEIAELIESRDETQLKIREIRASLGDNLIALHQSPSEESNPLEIGDAFDRLDGEEETTELEISDAFDLLDGED